MRIEVMLAIIAYELALPPQHSIAVRAKLAVMMNDVAIEPRSAAVFAGLAVALWLKGLIVSYVQVRARVRHRAFARAEDAAMMRRAPQPEPAVAQRAGDAWRNEIENGPFFLGIASAAVLVGASYTTLAAIGALFVLARSVHAWAQIAALQPLRTIAWLAGVFTTLALAGVTLSAAKENWL
jgi:microsomal prostaglandin-E synthase 1